MDNKALYQIKMVLENIDQSLYTLAKDINILTKKILKESKEDDEERI